jgi:hypothetical protein
MTDGFTYPTGFCHVSLETAMLRFDRTRKAWPSAGLGVCVASRRARWERT